jgi:tetratricopeptide (TPR) repeat protein
MGIQLQAALLEALVTYLFYGYPQMQRLIPVTSMLGNGLLVPAIIRAAAWAVTVYMLLSDADAGYLVAAGVALADLAWAVAGYSLNYLNPLLAGLNASFAAVICIVALAALASQWQGRVRLKVVPDRGLDSALLFHRRALVYGRQGKWALAAVHWQRAITRAPREPTYYKALGRAQARLGRYDQAVQSFGWGAEAAPDDPEFTRLIEWAQSSSARAKVSAGQR